MEKRGLQPNLGFGTKTKSFQWTHVRVYLSNVIALLKYILQIIHVDHFPYVVITEMALQAFIPETCLWGCIDSNFFPLCWMRGHVCSDFVALCDHGCRGERMKWGVCSCSLSFSHSNVRWKHVLDTLSKHHNSLENSLNGSLQRRMEGGESCINDKCVIWSTALSCSLSIFHHSLLHTHIFPFIVFFLALLSFALLPSRVYFPVAHSTLLGYFLWYTNVSLSFYVSVYLPHFPSSVSPSPLFKALIPFDCPLFPITQLIYHALVSISML